MQRTVANAPVLSRALLQPLTRWMHEDGSRVELGAARAILLGLTARVAGYFTGLDLLLTPTVGLPPPRVGELDGLTLPEEFPARPARLHRAIQRLRSAGDLAPRRARLARPAGRRQLVGASWSAPALATSACSRSPTSSRRPSPGLDRRLQACDRSPMGLLPRRARSRAAAVELLRALGGRGSAAAIEAFCARGPAAVTDLLQALADRVRFENDSHPADYYADFDDCLARLARAHPDRFVDTVARRPDLLQWSGVLGAIGEIAGERTADWLHGALEASSGLDRWRALRLLLACHDLPVRAKLAGLLRDRDSSVRFEAADGLRRWGEPAAIEPLLRYRERAPIGGAERALDAVESICRRAGIPVPPQHPGARLTEVELPPGAAVDPNLEALVVPAGHPLADAGGETIQAPVAAQVVAIDRDPNGPPRRIVLRR